MDRLEPRSVDAVDPLAPVLAGHDQTHLPKYAQVFRDQGLAQAEPGDQVTDRSFPAGQRVQELPPTGLGNGIEGIGRGRGSGHRKIICLYGHVSSTWSPD